MIVTLARVLARISKMPAQKSNLEISAWLDLVSQPLQILIPNTFNSHAITVGLLGKYLTITT